MSIILAFSSAFFAGITAILSKIGVKDIDSDLATAIRTTVVLFSSWVIVILTGNISEINLVSTSTLVFLMLSGFSTGASWIFYFRAIKYGDINKVTPIDKSSTILTIILSFAFLGESFNYKTLGAIIILIFGTFFMLPPKNITTDLTNTNKNNWFLSAILSAIFASLTAILGKVGVQDINSTLATAIRTIFVFISAWFVIYYKKTNLNFSGITRKS